MNVPNFTISTPTGKRVLHWIGGGHACVNEGFAPDDANKPRERLQFRRGSVDVRPEPDGVWIGERHLLTVAIGLATKRKGPISLTDVVARLFYEPLRPANAGAAIAALPNDEFLQTMHGRFGRYDPTTDMINPVTDGG